MDIGERVAKTKRRTGRRLAALAARGGRHIAIGYARNSIDIDASIEGQEEDIDDDALVGNYDLLETWCDGVGAFRTVQSDREGWTAAMNALEGRPEVTMLTLREVSRAWRKAAEWSQFLTFCEREGIAIRLAKSGTTYDVTQTEQWKSLIDGGVASEYESRMLGDRQRQLGRRRAAKGIPSTQVAYGYKKVYEEGRAGRMIGCEPDEDPAPENPIGSAAETVKFMVKWLLDGKSRRGLARHLNELGVPVPTRHRILTKRQVVTTQRKKYHRREPTDYSQKKWSYSQIKMLLTNPAYTGARLYDGVVTVPSAWEPLITKDDFAALVRLFKANSREPVRRGSEPKSLSVGIARCVKCLMTVYRRPCPPLTNGDRPHNYTCRGISALGYRASDGHVGSGRVTAVDQYVEEFVLTWARHPRTIERVKALLNRTATEKETADRIKLDDLRSQFAEAEAMWADGEIGREAMLKRKAILAPEIKGLEDALRPHDDIDPAVEDFVGPEAHTKWKAMSLIQRREILCAVADVVISPPGRGNRPRNEWITITPRI